MSLDLTRPSLFRSVLYFLMLYALFRIREYTAVEPALPSGEMMPLESWFTRFFERHLVWKEIALLLLTFLNAFYITRILSRNLIYLERTYVPALIYLAVALGYTVSGLTPIALAVSFLLVFAVDDMIKSYKKEENFGYFLHASVALGLAPILYAPAAIFVLLLPVGFVLFRQNGRSVATAILGYLLPLFFCSYVLWGMGEDFSETVRRIFSIVTASSPGELFIFRMQPWDYALAGLFLFLTAVALVHFSRNRATMRRRSLRGYTIFIWTLVIALGMTALPCRSLDMLPIVAVPLAAVIPACFNRKSGWWPNLLYVLMIGSVVAYNLFLLFH